MKDHTIILNFNYTLISCDSMAELAEFVLKKSKNKEKILKQFHALSEQAVNGEITPAKAMEQRLQLLQPTREQIKRVVPKLKKKISVSIARNKAYIKKNANNIYVLSYGLKDLVQPVAASLGILPEHVFAIAIEYDKQGNIASIDKQSLLAKPNGKIRQANKLKWKHPLLVFGNHPSDFELKQEGIADHFFGYTEHKADPAIVEKADYVIPSFDEFLYRFKLDSATSYPKNRIRVLLLENIHPIAVKMLKEEGYRVEQESGSLSEDELVQRIEKVSILGIRSKTKVTAKVLAGAKQALSIGAFCIGTNQIDLVSCQHHGIPVFNAPYSNTRSVVELTIGLLIVLMRETFDKSVAAHQGKWKKGASNSNEIRGKTIGIIGYGNIGSQLSVLAESLGMKVLYYDIQEKLTLGNAQKCNSMREVLKKADIITIHVDGSGPKKPIITEKELNLMKDGVIFLNLARGFLVDTDALAKAIREGKVRGAAVDVFPEEPKNNDEPFSSTLQNLPNTILTPHVGGSTVEAQMDIARFVAENIIRFVNTGSTTACVNFPNLQLQEVKNGHRFIHIHKNVPGVLADITNVFSKHKINILGQHLKTNETIGYVITDVAREYDPMVISDLKNIPNTIRLRLLY